MLKPSRALFLAALTLITSQSSEAREWTDLTGNIKINGTMIASDESEVVIKLDKKHEDHELLAVPLEHLSQNDRDYLESQEAKESLREAGEKQVWEMNNGLKVYGKLVDFVVDDVVIQRRRGRIYVNDRVLENLPEVYQKMLPKLVAHFEKKPIETEAEFIKWVTAQKGNAVNYHVEAITLEFPNGDEYDIPLVFLNASTFRAIRPEYDQWSAAQKDSAERDEQYAEKKRQQDLYLQSRAVAMQQQNEMLKIARLQLVMNSVTAGATNLWEVALYPRNGFNAYPIFVVVPARDSETASVIAMQRNPGLVAGPVRKVAGY